MDKDEKYINSKYNRITCFNRKKIQAFQDHLIRANPTHTPETMCCSFLKHKAL